MRNITISGDIIDFSQEQLRNWLRFHSKRAFLSGDGCHCPVAGFLNAKAPLPKGRFWNVADYYAEVVVRRSNGKHFPAPYAERGVLPKWVQRFINLVDSRLGAPITGKEALELIDGQ